MRNVLVLNASYEPLSIVSFRRATCLVLDDKAEIIEHDGGVLRSPSLTVPVPSVVRLRYMVRVARRRQAVLSRRAVFARDDHTCQYCGAKENLSIDHVMPRSRGGGDSWDNVTTACMRCNVRKGNRTPQEAAMPLRKMPRRPLSSLSFDAVRQINSGGHSEWAKYVIGA